MMMMNELILGGITVLRCEKGQDAFLSQEAHGPHTVLPQPVAAVCHGPAALTKAVKPGTHTSILSGITVTGFSNAEEAQTPYNDFVNILPFSLEDKITSLGGKYTKADAPWGSKVVYDGGVLTGGLRPQTRLPC